MFIFLLFSLTIFIFFYMCEKSKINVFVTFILTIIVCYLIIFPKSSIDSILLGANLFIKSVFPTLFPFLILTNILINYGGIRIFGNLFGFAFKKLFNISQNSIFPLLVSFICGYPLGTKYVEEVYEENLIDKNEFNRIVHIASNASPLFIIGTVGFSILNNKNLGYFLLIANYVSCIIVSFFLPYNKSFRSINEKHYFKKNKNFGDILKSSIENSIKTCSIVGGYIILFSLIREILLNNIYTEILFNDLPVTKSLLIGFFEITNGINLISETSISLNLKLSLISALCSFSGMCIILQCYSFVYKNNNFNLKKYILFKFFQAIIAFIITFILCYFFIKT